tara:strand:- start:7653 stop:7979 length:327 start_codon:yes stop_codon:yes gene_type:complete
MRAENDKVIHHNKLSNALVESDFFLITLIMLTGVLTKLVRSAEPISIRVICGELLLAFMMALFLYLLGLYEGLTSIQITLIAIPSSLGNARLLQYMIHIINPSRFDKR